MKVQIITCDNCGKQVDEEHLNTIKGHDICTDCLSGTFVLDVASIKQWPRWITRDSVVEALKHEDQKQREVRVIQKEGEINKALEAEILNLPLSDPTKLMKEVELMQSRVRRLHVGAA